VSEAAETDVHIDREKLQKWMDERRLPGSGEPLEVRLISGGSSNELLELKRGPHRIALRQPPRPVPKGRNEIMLREYRVLHALNGTDVPHSEAIAVCDDPSVIGACFYLMEIVDGWSPMNTQGWPAPFDRDLAARAGLATQLVDGIAKLSLVDWKARGLEGLGKPVGYLDRQADRWLYHLSTFKIREIPGLDVAAAWLRRHTPKSFRPGILHGDYQFANVMFRHGAPARLAAIIDWEMSTIGDPLVDLAWVIMGWPDPGEDRAGSGYVDYTGMPSRAELLHTYSKVSGLAVDLMDYYIVLARFKMACVLEGGYARHVTGTQKSEKLAAFGPIVLDMALKAAELSRTSKLPPTS
jgi:aminoglycoside phosphotransferase (APT) family kinase protein